MKVLSTFLTLQVCSIVFFVTHMYRMLSQVLCTSRTDVPSQNEEDYRKTIEDGISQCSDQEDMDQARPQASSRKKHFMSLYFTSNKNDRTCARFRKVSVKTDDISDLLGKKSSRFVIVLETFN